MSDHEALFQRVCDYARQTALLSSIHGLLEWDEHTIMPVAAAEYRAEQMAYVAGACHRRTSDAEYGRWLGELSESPLAQPADSDAGTTIRRLRRDHQRAVRVPQSLIEEIARTTVLAEQAWREARKRDDFPLFRPMLERMLHLKRAQAEALGYERTPYDALLDEYEPGARTAELAKVLAGLRDDLVPLVAAIRESGRRPPTDILAREYPPAAQEAFGREVAAEIGFDFQRGRLDPTVHPFCATMGPSDCRITTRYNARFFNEAFFGILHESGHGLYEQGLRSDWFGLPPGQAASLGVHESQSRFWENVIARSEAFWQRLFPQAQKHFPAALSGVRVEQFYFAVNDVRPSLIRVEADEATYNLHILVRFELEIALLEDRLAVADLPQAWNDQYEKCLGVRPANDREGVLQDIHWSGGLVGYFPTYTLGNLIAAQLAAQADRDLGGLAQRIAQGQFDRILQWLRDKVHRQGQRYPAPELVQRITGDPLSHQPLIRYLRAKLGPLYGIK